jgi:hypothetical protein
VTAVVSLSLAIGANTAIYCIVDAVMLRPLPVLQADMLFTLATPEADQPGIPVGGESDTFSYPLYEQLRAAAGDTARIALFDSPNRAEAQDMAADAPREDLIEQFVSPDAFDVLGVPSAQGRLFSLAEDRFPAPRSVVVLSYEYWRRRFGMEPGIVGQSFIVNGRTYSILGVAREGFSGAEPGKFVDVWLPITLNVNRAFARRYFGNESVLGTEFRRDDGARHRIVGLAANSHFGNLHNGPEPIAYMPMKPPRGFTLYVRSTLDAASVAKMVEREAGVLGSGMRVRDVATLDALVGTPILKEKLLAGIGGAFAFLGLILAAIGLFGLLN